MGAVHFLHDVFGTSPKSVYNALVEYAEEIIREEAEDEGIAWDEDCLAYSGLINTCEMGEVMPLAGAYSADEADRIARRIREKGEGEKWRADIIDCGVAAYAASGFQEDSFWDLPADACAAATEECSVPIHRYLVFGYAAM